MAQPVHNGLSAAEFRRAVHFIFRALKAHQTLRDTLMVTTTTSTPTLSGVADPTDVYGIAHGDGGAKDALSGTSGADKLQGAATFNQYYGSAGNDTSIISAKTTELAHEGASKGFTDQAFYAADFGGAGGWSSSNNDFLAFSGFGAGSHIDLVSSKDNHSVNAPTAVLYYYTITDGVTGEVHNFMVNSTNGHALAKGDYNFY